MAKKKQKQKTRIRTTSGALSDRFGAKLLQIKENPTVVLAEGYETIPQLKKMGARIAKLANKAPSFWDRQNGSLLGSVAHSIDASEQDAFPRLADAKISGQRRFFLHRGHVPQMVNLGIQNFDVPDCLILAYADLAKKYDFHCWIHSGKLELTKAPIAPKGWMNEFEKALGAKFTGDSEDHSEFSLQFGKAGTQVCLAGKKGRNSHQILAEKYRGPGGRLPVTITPLHGKKVDREDLAKYRAGILDDAGLVRALA